MRNLRNVWWTFIAIVVVFLAAVFVDLPGTKTFLNLPVRVNQGIDIAGGARLLLCAPKTQTPAVATWIRRATSSTLAPPVATA